MPHPNTPNQLSDDENQAFLNALNSPQYRDLPPEAAVAAMADAGIYYGSASTAYRLLREHGLVKRRPQTETEAKRKPKPHCAKAPREVWSWDITYLPCRIKGAWYYLYLIMDIYSRKIVGAEVYEEETAERAAQLIRKTAIKEHIIGKHVILHSDNGAPMKGFTMQAMMNHLGIEKSYSRPHTSDDNAYSESLFRTLKNMPQYPESGFASLEEARRWTAEFVEWYNTCHLHSALQYLTPEQVHSGKAEEILQQREEVYRLAQQRTPQRWRNGLRKWTLPKVVWLNMRPPHLPC